jgi:uncharacterized repeat protein (TIGR03803 family)
MESKRVPLLCAAVIAASVFVTCTRVAAQQERVLVSFFTVGKVGKLPFGPLTFDAANNLYGTTASGGTYNGGTVFELMPEHSGK